MLTLIVLVCCVRAWPGDDGVAFDGSSRIVVEDHAFSLGPNVSVVGSLQATEDSAGYIFAKTSQDGNTRHLALYMSTLCVS